MRQHQRLLVESTTLERASSKTRPETRPVFSSESERWMDQRDGRVVGLHHVQLAMPQGEEEAAVKFYGYMLGLEQISKPPELAPRGGVWFRGPSIEFHLGVEDGFRPATKAHPAFLVAGLEQLLTRLDTAGIRIVEDEIQLEGFHRVFVRDPFGNRIELIEPG